MRLAVAIFSLWQFSAATSFAWENLASGTECDVQDIATAIQMFREDKGSLPKPGDYWSELVSANLVDPSWKSFDAWKRPLIYRVPGRHGAFDLYSSGADGLDQDGRGDDISSWAGVNDGYYWKSSWPEGRYIIIAGSVLAATLLLLRLRSGSRWLTPVAGILFFVGLSTGCTLLLHPGIVPNRNAPLSFAISLSDLAVVIFIIQLLRLLRATPARAALR